MKPGEHKTVQARILAYAQEVGWSFVSRDEAEGALLGQFRHLHTDIYGNPPSPRLRRTGRVFNDLERMHA